MVSSRDYSIRGDPEGMLRALKGALPGGARHSGNSTHGTINVLLSTIVEYWRQGTALKVTVYKGALVYGEDDIWNMIENGLRGYV